MKSVDRKILVPSLIGVALVAPFLVIASIVGIHAVTLAANARPEVFCLLLALASIAARISDGHLALTNIAEERKRC
jgi:Ca2+/H+ antiporter